MIEKPPAIWLPPKPAIIRAWKREDAKRATFPFPFFVPSSAVIPTLSYRTNAVSASNLTTYTFAAADIGTAAANRHVIVGVVSRHASAANTVSSATIAGVSAAIVADGVISNSQAALLIAAVPTGTTGDVVVTLTGGAERCGIVIWAAYGLLSATPVASLNTASGTLDINTSANGIIVAVNIGVSQTPVWSGITEALVDTVLEGVNEYSAASDSLTLAATPRAVSRSGLGTAPVTAIASFR